MDNIFKKSQLALLVGLPLGFSSVVLAAVPVDLSKQNVDQLPHFFSAYNLKHKPTTEILETKRSIDFNQTLHLRMQQTYQGYKIFGADAVMHIPKADKTKSFRTLLNTAHKSTVNGIFYQDIAKDLASSSLSVKSKQQAEKALQTAINLYYEKVKAHPAIHDAKTELMIYVDQSNQAKWAYKINFDADAVKIGEAPARPTYLLAADSLAIERSWDDIKTIHKVQAMGGGFGGNQKMGKLIYDGLRDHFDKFTLLRDNQTKTCFLRNNDITVDKYGTRKTMTFPCAETDSRHNKVYWNSDFDHVNGGYSPANDAFYAGTIIMNLYRDWYKVPVLIDSQERPMLLRMVVHVPHYDNAYWNGREMTFGDGAKIFYPLTSLGVAAHEISHGFTEQHSDLIYDQQSGGLNEAFSDMAAQAAEVYAYGVGNNSWQIGAEIVKNSDEALRYMDQPSRDCGSKNPGNWCSIDDASQYHDTLDVHYSSGVYNRFFYLLATTKGWTVKKAFNIMVQANANYWTANTGFNDAACGVIKAARDYKYSIQDVKAAFNKVKVDYHKC